MKCGKCGKELEEQKLNKNNELCNDCNRKRKVKRSLIITISIVAILFVLCIAIMILSKVNVNNKSNTNNRKYDIESTLNSVVKVGDEYFEKQKKSEYKDYELIFISFSLKNKTGKNFENIEYKLKTNNGNSYSNTSGSYITTDNPYLVEDFLKLINHESSKEEEILGEQEKTCIIGFLIPKNEIKNENNFELEIGGANTIQPINFRTVDIKQSDTLKELFKDTEIEEIEQRISLYYLIEKLVNTNNLQTTAWNSGDVNSLILYISLNIECLNNKFPISWDGQYLDKNADGYKLNYEKAKQIFPEIKEDITRLENSKQGLENANSVLRQYSDIGRVNYNEFSESSAGIGLSWYNISQYFKQ